MNLRILLLLMLIAGFEPVILSADDSELSHFYMMVDKADIIFRGKVISKEYHDLDIGDMIFPFTYYTFEIHNEFKGESPDGTLIVRTPGGGGVVMVSTTGGFSLGGEYLLFLEEFDKGTSVSGGGRFRIELGPISGNPVLLTSSGWQVLDIDENGPILSKGKIAGPDQIESDRGILIVDGDKLVDEVAVDFEGLFDKLKQHISKRQTESTYKPGKKVKHAPTGNWVIE